MLHARFARNALPAGLVAVAVGLPAQVSFEGSPSAPLELPWGAAAALGRGPTISVRLLRAADGSGAARFLIDRRTPGCVHRVAPINGGHRHHYRCSFTDPALGSFKLDAELDVLGRNGQYDLLARITGVPSALAVSSLGIELELRDVRGVQSLLIPVFSGGEFVEPATTIPPKSPIDTSVAHSVQATAYYGDDGSGLLLFVLDPAATKPKHYFASSGRSLAGQPVTRFAFEFYLPNTHLGGRQAATPVAMRIVPYSYDPTLGPGWYTAAKLYRAWVEASTRRPGGILERGPLETRSDVPTWMREIDLFNHDRYGWYPGHATVPNPLFALRRYKTELGAKHMLVGLWFWNDACTPLGRHGSWLPLAGTVQQVRALLADSIRFAGYTFASFDVLYPNFLPLGFDKHAVQDRNGNPKTYFILSKGQKNTLWFMDVASPAMAEWFEILGRFHASFSGISAFYFDFPATVENEDFHRPSGDLGISEDAYRGYGEMMRRARKGGLSVGREFSAYHEAAYEWLIRSTPTGEGPNGVVGRAYPGEARTRGVPFFQSVYSGYSLFWPADELYGPAYLTFLPDAYGDPRKSNMSRLLAEGFTWGHILNSSDFALKDGKLFWEAKVAEPLHSMLQHHKKLLGNLIALRRLARPWLVYGEMMQSPVAGGDSVDMTIQVLFGAKLSNETFRKLAVPTTAWRAKDGSLRLVAANGGRTAAAVDLDLRRVGLTGAWHLADVQTKEKFQPDAQGRIRVRVPGGTGRLLAPAR